MTLSEVFYEAAWLIGSGPGQWMTSCNAVGAAGRTYVEVEEYKKLMEPSPGDFSMYHVVDAAAAEVGWSEHDYRTFMLLMASEAVK